MATEQWFFRDFREDLGVNQAAVAKAAGVTQVKISEFERGTDKPTPDQRRAIVDFLVRRAAVRGLEILILERKS
jgi:predicted transcriptional regulator